MPIPKPNTVKKTPDFLAINFKEDPLTYINAVRDYSFEGNLPEWDPFQNKTREWYHIPWLHPTTANGGYPPNGGTEGFRGLIKEAPLGALQLGPNLKGIDGDYETPLVKGKECAYTVFSETGVASCGIEKANKEGVIDFDWPKLITEKQTLFMFRDQAEASIHAQ